MSLQDTLPRTAAVFAEGVERGHHFGGQIAVYQNGSPVINEAFGTLGPGVDDPMTPDHILCWRSAGKPWTAVVVLQLVNEGAFTLDHPIKHWFADDDWHTFVAALPADSALRAAPPTIRELLTHTAGWQPMETGWPDISVDESLRRVLHSPLRDGALPGATAAYDPQAGWLVLGEIIFKTTGLEVAECLQSRVFDAAAVEATLKYSPDRIAQLTDRLAPQFDTNRGATELLPLTTTSALTTSSPGSSSRGPIASLAKLYATLLADRHVWDDDAASGPQSPTLLEPATIGLMTQRHREGLKDLTFHHTIDFGLGVIVNSNRYGAETVPYGFGRHASESAFGHGGAQCAIGFADPERELAVAWVVNGLPGEPRHNKRNREVNSAIYEDLGLAK